MSPTTSFILLKNISPDWLRNDQLVYEGPIAAHHYCRKATWSFCNITQGSLSYRDILRKSVAALQGNRDELIMSHHRLWDNLRVVDAQGEYRSPVFPKHIGEVIWLAYEAGSREKAKQDLDIRSSLSTGGFQNGSYLVYVPNKQELRRQDAFAIKAIDLYLSCMVCDSWHLLTIQAAAFSTRPWTEHLMVIDEIDHLQKSYS